MKENYPTITIQYHRVHVYSQALQAPHRGSVYDARLDGVLQNGGHAVLTEDMTLGMWHDKHNPKVDKEATFVVAAIEKKKKRDVQVCILGSGLSQKTSDPTE